MRKKRASSSWRAGSEAVSRIPYFLLLFLAMALPLAAFPHLFEDVFDLPKTTLLWTVSLLTAGFWLIKGLYGSKIGWRKSSLDIPLIAFSLAVILATIFSYDRTSSLLSATYKRHETLPTWLAYFFLFFAASNFLREPRRILTFLKAIVLTSLLVSAYGILQHFGYDVFSYQVSNVDRFRSFSSFGNAVFLGSYLVFVVPLALSLMFAERNRRVRPVWLVALFLAMVTLAFTYTRGAWMGGVLALAVWAVLALSRGQLLSPERKKWLFILVAAFLLAVLVIALGEKVFPIDISLKERVVSAVELRGSVASRLSIWRTTLRAISLRPSLGWGPETQRLVSAPLRERFFVDLEGPSKIADRPHNQILHIGYSFGMMGLFAYLWVLSVFFFSMTRLRETKEPNFFPAVGVIAAVVGYLMQEQFAFSVVGVTPFFWLLLGASTNLLGTEQSSNEYRLGSHLLRYTGLIATVVLVVMGVLFALRLAAADFYYQKAIRASQTGTMYESLELFRKAVQLNPWEVRYLFAFGEKAKGVALNDRRIYWLDEAASVYRKGLGRHPFDYDLYFGLGNVYYVKAFLSGQRNYGEAREAYARALVYEPYFVEAYVWLGKTYLAEGKVEPALKNLDAATGISPNNVSALDGLAQAYEKKGDVPRAVSYLKQILTIDPYYRPALQELERLKGAS